MGKKSFNKDKKMFFDTLTDIKRLVQSNTNSYTSQALGVSKKSTKIPYNHLMGRRNAIKERYKNQKTRAREESIQYDSNMNLMNSSVMKEYERKNKDEYLKNKYKYNQSTVERIGRQNKGFLQISKKDLDRINGKKQRNRNNNDIHMNRKRKKKFIKKNKVRNKKK